MTWMPSRTGRVIELVEPQTHEVDFADLAWSLAHLNRYCGHGDRQVSVALHTLIGLEICAEELRPWWLIHDAEESRTGDLTFPAFEALVAIAYDLGGPKQARAVTETWQAFKKRHSAVIHKAAGLDLPMPAQAAEIKRIDLVALATEHRDFHNPSLRPWHHESTGVAGARKVARPMAPDRAADALLTAFRQYLPGLQPRPVAAALSAARKPRRTSAPRPL